MGEPHILIGAEDVRAAASTIASAADGMRRAAGSIEESMEQHRRFMDDWLIRFEAVLKENMKGPT